MNFLRKIFSKRQDINLNHDARDPNPKQEYFESPRPSGAGLCSDNDCPCTNTKLPPGTGYMYISQATVDFRNDAKSTDEAYAKMERLMKKSGAFIVFDQQSIDGILMCEQAVNLRKLDKETASADAKHWWKTGWIPLRATPQQKLQ